MEEKETRISSLAKNTLILSIGTLLTKGLQFVMIPFFSRWLSVEEFGNFDVLSTYVSLLIPLITLACGEAVFRFSVDTEENENINIYVTNGLSIVLINSIFFGLLLLLFSRYFTYTSPGLFYLLLVSQLLNVYFQGFVRAIKKLYIYSLCNAVSTMFIALFVTFFVKVLGFGIDGIILGYSCGYMVGNLLLVIYTRYWNYVSVKNISISNMVNLIKYSYALIPNDISWWVMNASNRLLINIFLGASANGIFAIAYKVPSLCQAIFGVFGISWQQSATEMSRSNGKNKYYEDVYNKMIAVIISLCIGLLSLNFVLFDYIFDERYSTARYYTPILITAIIFLSISQFFGGIQISLKRPKENGYTTMIGACCNVIINMIFIRFIGLYAAALATLISNLIVTILRKRYLREISLFRIDRELYKYVFIYLYFVVVEYLPVNKVIFIFNFMLACILFLVINRDFISKLLSTLKKKLIRAKSLNRAE